MLCLLLLLFLLQSTVQGVDKLTFNLGVCAEKIIIYWKLHKHYTGNIQAPVSSETAADFSLIKISIRQDWLDCFRALIFSKQRQKVYESRRLITCGSSFNLKPELDHQLGWFPTGIEKISSEGMIGGRGVGLCEIDRLYHAALAEQNK